jgi:hypothetical protein
MDEWTLQEQSYKNGYDKGYADAKAELVRCKDCNKSKRSHLLGSGWRFCMNNSQHHKDEHFCSYGERREGE